MCVCACACARKRACVALIFFSPSLLPLPPDAYFPPSGSALSSETSCPASTYVTFTKHTPHPSPLILTPHHPHLSPGIEKLIDPLRSTIQSKAKANSVKQEYEKQDELKRSAMRAVAALLTIPDSGQSCPSL